MGARAGPSESSPMSKQSIMPGRRWWLIRVGIALPLGVVTTLLVACGLAAWMPMEGAALRGDSMSVPDVRVLEWIEIIVASRPGAVRRSWRYRDELRVRYGPAWLAAETRGPGRDSKPSSWPRWGALPNIEVPEEHQERFRVHGMEDARGWPWPALWCSMEDKGWGSGVTPPRITVSGGLALGQAAKGRVTSANFRALPWRPVWLGIGADSLVYAAAWMFVLVVPAMARRRRRFHRGRCPICAYDLVGDHASGCPECGWGRESGRLGAKRGSPE